MIKYRTKLIEKLTHGKSVSHLIKTITGKSKPPEVVTCFGSYKVNTRPLIDWGVETPDGDWQAVKLYFTYSRNGGPIQRVIIDEDVDDWEAIDALYTKIDTDLCRAQDGESLAFYILSDGMGLTEQVIPELNDIQSPPVLLPPIEPARMTMASVPEQPDYDYTITGIGGDGLIPIPNAFNIDSRNISIPHPYSILDPETVEWMAWPRWYPNNTIVKEDNTIVIYPSEGIEPHDFDLFSALGGVGNTPITINSCVKAVPRKYNCTASHVVGSQVRSLILARMALAESGVQSTAYREPIRFSDTPFPFKAAAWSDDPASWPPYMPGESGTWGHDWVATYRRNDGPLKFITWNTGSLNPGSHHSVWDAIKELLLDDYGRTAFMLSDFNSTASSYNDGGDITVKSGIRSNLNFTTKPFEEGEPLHRYIQPYRFSGKSVEVRDRQIQFSDVNAGAVWNENTITIYPTPWEVINDYGFDGQLDYYEYLCQYYDQLEAGEPITIHSCAAVEPADHIQVNTSITLNSPEEEEVPRMMGQGLSAAIRLNDGAVKYFKFEPHEVNVALNEILTYLYFMGKTPKVTTNQGDGTVLKINDLYFRSNFTAHSSEISGCSGTERDQEFWMPVGNPMDYEDPNSTPSVSILETLEPYKRESNKATFIKHPVNGYIDLFDSIKYTEGTEHTIYSSAVVPSVIWANAGDGEGPGGDGSIDDLEDEYMQWREPWVFSITKTNGMGESFNPTISAVYGTDFVIVDHDTGERLASTFGRTHEGIIERIPENKNLNIIFNMDALGGSRTFELHFGITGGSVVFGNDIDVGGRKEGELEIIQWNSDCAPKIRISAANMTVTLPDTLPVGWNNLSSMFKYTNMANPDISMWDVSNVVDMEYMFHMASGFNQDLSSWCVERISSEPYYFRNSATAWTKPQPIWGTCPKEEITLPEDAFVVELTKYRNGYYSASKSDVGIVRTARSGANWQLHNILTGELLCDQNGIYNYNVIHDANSDDTTYIKLPLNQKMIVGMTGEFGGVKMYVGVAERYSDDMTIYGAVNILQYPSTVLSIEHAVEGYELTIPHELPSGLTTLDNYFMDSNLFNQDISHWDISAIGSTNNMFYGAKSFNQDISKWDVSNVHAMTTMFTSAQAFNQDLSQWCVKHIDGLGYQWDYDTPNWSLPRPIWGTCPEKTSVKLIVTSNDTSDSEGRLALQLEGVVGEWSLYEDGVKVIDNNSTSSINTNVGLEGSTLYIDLINLRNTVREFEVFATADNLKISQSSMYDVYRDVNVVKFSNDINNYIFELPKCTLSVPETLPTHITSTKNMFNGCNSFNQDLSKWDVSNVTDMDSMFQNCKTFDSSIANWNVSNVTTMQYIFSGCHIFNSELNNWNVSKVVSMRQMFSDCNVFNQDLSKWDVSNVTNMEGLFTYATAFNHDLSTWNTSSVTNMKSMFESAVSFNKPIGNWNVSKVTNMNSIFLAASSFNQDIGSWDVSNVWPMYNMFEGATSFNQDLSKWCVSQHDEKPYMFDNNAIAWTMSRSRPVWGTCPPPPPQKRSFTFSTLNSTGASKELPLKLNLTGTGNSWSLTDVDTGVVIANDETLGGASGVEVGLYLDSTGATSRNYRLDGQVNGLSIALEGDSSPDGLLEVKSFSDDISEYRYNLKDADILVPTTLPSHITSLDYMFAGCLKFDQDITGWDTSNVTSMEGTFKGCYSFNQDIGNWNVSNVTNMASTFAECTMFNRDLSNWNTASLTNLSHTFAGCSNFNGPLNTWDVSKVTMLVSTFASATSFDQPLSNWDVGMAYTMRECFSGASSFNQDISTWNVERVEDMQYAFNSALSFNPDLSVWDTASLLNLEGTFKDAVLFNSDLSLWDTSQVVTLSSTFQGATAFNQPLNDWDVSKVHTMQSTFAGAVAFNQPLNNWDVSNVGGSFPMYGMFEGATLFNQDLSSWCVPDVEYINKFDEGATSWSEPRPPWGYCGLQVVSSLQFTITTGNVALDNDRLTIGFPEGKPGAFKILKDGVLTNTSPDGYDSDIMNQYGQIAIYVPPNTTRTFTLQASAPVAQLRYYTDNTNSTNKIAIDAFSDNILRYEFSIQNADLTVPQTLPVHITSMFAMFKDSNRFNQDLSGWDVSRITNATDAFRDCVAFNGGVGTWRLDKLGNAQRMFKGCKVFNQPLNNWRFPELRVAIEMFSGCSAFNQDLNSWNVSGIRDFEGMFSGCTVFNGTITDWDMTGAAVLHKMFYNATAFNQPIGNWNVASVSNFDGMFSYAISFNQDISTWDMSGVKNVNGLANMFAQATGFNQDLSTWNVLKVPSRPYEFDSGLTTTWKLPRPKWGTDGKPIVVPPIVPYDSNSFNVLIEQTETQSPTNVNITLNLNQDASDWEVWIGDEMIASPQYAKAPVTVSNNTITIPNSNNRTQIAVKGSMSTVALLMASPVPYTSLGKITTSVINYSPTINSYRFTVKEAALTVPDTLPSHITSLSEMFKECTNILSDITGWDTSNIMYATSMLNGATNFNQDLSGWNVVNIKSKPTSFDDYCNSWTLPRPIWGSTGTPVVVPPPPMPEYTPFEFNVTSSGGAGFALETSGAPTEWMLYQDDVLITTEETMFNHRVSDLKEGVTNFKLFTDGGSINMREGSAGTNTTIDFLSFCEAVPRTNFSIQSYNFTVPKTLPANHTDLRDMFKGCNAFNQDLSEWDTSRVTDMSQMFYETDVFNGNITTWNTSQVTNFTRMFSSARVFNQDISNWDVSNALYMGGMFDIALVFNQPIGNWDISKVTSTQDMFKNAWEFNQDLSSWNVSNVQSMDGMFFVAKTFNQDLSGWNVAHIPDEPINFANLAAAWSEPKPKWGEQPASVQKNFKFTVDNTMNEAVRTFEVNLHSSDFCNISRNGELVYMTGTVMISGDEVITSNTWPDRTVYITVPAGVKNTYEVSNATVKIMKMSVNAYNNLSADITVLSFSDTIPHYQFNVEGWVLKVEDKLPPVVTSTYLMFWNARNFNSDISAWDVSNLTDMSYMFYGAASFNQDLSTWNTTAILEEPTGFAVNAVSWTLPHPTWGPTVDCAGATENVTLNISGGVSDLIYKVEINGHVFNEDGAVDISTGWHEVAPGLYFMCEDNGDNTLTMTVYEDDALNTLPVKLTPISHLTTATITGGDAVSNPTFKYDEGTSSVSFCVITEWAA